MYLWRRTAEIRWLKAHEDLLQAHAHGQLVIVRRPERKRLELEIVCRSRSDSSALLTEFGGWIEALPRNWLERFARGDSKPIKIGKRLVIVRSMNELRRCSVRCPQRSSRHRARPDTLRTAHPTAHTIKPACLVIPASLAFGTGEHATTAMSLRLLERLTRQWEKGWSLADLGTGSGILALAAKRFGAGRVTGIDIDPKAISIAKANARLNKIDNVDFQLGDVRRWKPGARWDVIAANLYNELLISVVSKLNRSNWLILSGVLRRQEDELLRVLQKNNREIASVKRRGKWMALMACKRQVSNTKRRKLNHF